MTEFVQYLLESGRKPQIYIYFFSVIEYNKIQINYARVAKKMDMRRLKATMWTMLNEVCAYLLMMKIGYIMVLVFFLS